MDDKDYIINMRLMEEFGLEQGVRRRVYDHETGDMRTLRGKEIVAPGALPGKRAIEFDPIGNTRMMNYFFGSYVESLSEGGVINGDILSYSTIPSKTPGKVKAVLKVCPNDGGPIQEICSKPYKNETVCYADLVCRINGDENVDMSEYDYERKREAPVPMKFQTAPKKGIKK